MFRFLMFLFAVAGVIGLVFWPLFDPPEPDPDVSLDPWPDERHDSTDER